MRPKYKARTGRLLQEKLISYHGLFSCYEGRLGGANGQDSWGFFRDAQGFGLLDAGSRAAASPAQGKGSTTMDLGILFFLISVEPTLMYGLEKLGLVDQN